MRQNSSSRSYHISSLVIVVVENEERTRRDEFDVVAAFARIFNDADVSTVVEKQFDYA